jgi:hypothetical protein
MTRVAKAPQSVAWGDIVTSASKETLEALLGAHKVWEERRARDLKARSFPLKDRR